MVTILVDYENVNGKYGLNGAEYLMEDDDLHIFYSGSCPNIRLKDITDIEESGCSLSICELGAVRKNAMDFYIATEAGIAYQSGAEYIIIVTQDDGLHSVKDYFEARELDAKLIVASSIEKGLLKLKGKERHKRIGLDRKNVKQNLLQEYARISERRAIKKRIVDCLSGTEFEEDISRVLACVDKVGISSKQDLYRGSMHEFGIVSGTAIYNMLKKVV